MRTLTIAVISTLLLLNSQHAVAEEYDRLTGSIGIGALVIDSANNLNPNGSDRRIDSLEQAADRNTSGVFAILPRITWDAGEQDGLKLYLDTDPPIDEVGGFSLNLGATYPMEKIGTLDTSLFFTPFEEVWEDPYLTDEDRNESDTSKYGLKLGLNRILGTGLRANVVFLTSDVDNDLVALSYPELARDGEVYSLNINYSFYPTGNIEIRPRFSVRKGDYDGDANSFIKYKFDLEARLKLGNVMLIPRVFYSYKEYDEVHPIFEKTRDEDGYGASLLATYMAPFNLPNYSLTALLSFSRGQSNIDFYDTEATTAGAFLNYHF